MGQNPPKTILSSRTDPNLPSQPKRWLRVYILLANSKKSTRGKVWVSRRVWLGNTWNPRRMRMDTPDSAKTIIFGNYSKTGMGKWMETSKGRHLVINVGTSFFTLKSWGSITNYLSLSCPQNKPLTRYRDGARVLVSWTLCNAREDVWLLSGHKALLYPADGSGLWLCKQNNLRWKNAE